jgi:hypothetical protein
MPLEALAQLNCRKGVNVVLPVGTQPPQDTAANAALEASGGAVCDANSASQSRIADLATALGRLTPEKRAAVLDAVRAGNDPQNQQWRPAASSLPRKFSTEAATNGCETTSRTLTPGLSSVAPTARRNSWGIR